SNFDFSKANADGSDIRFTEDDGETLLPYWIEKWDSTSEEAIIWVKVPSIPANGDVTIYMYYGNSEAVSESDGEAVFEFFDDFEGDSLDWDKWYHWLTGGSTSVSNSEVTVAGGSNSWEGIGSKTKFSPPIVVEFKAKVTAEGNKFGLGLDERAADGTYVGSGYSVLSWYYDSTKGGKIYQHTYESSFHFYSRATDLTTYRILTLVWTSSKVQFYEDGVLGKEITTDIPSDSLAVYLSSYNSARKVVADWVRVRKYAEQEPTVNVGSEEMPMPAMKYWDGSQWKDIKAIYYWDGSSWVTARGAYYWDGSQWVQFWSPPAPFGTVVREASSPSTFPNGIGGDSNVIWHCDKYVNDVYELSTTDFSVVRSASSPSTFPNGIGGDSNVIWHCDDDTEKVYELSTTDFSVVRSASSPSTIPNGIGGDSSVIWHSDYNTDKVYELSTTDFSVVRSA
ncbi:MAG: DUF2341 domain-containing protein, partial [Candidatus Hydrothermae bacterium]|nr:DUF2341 domain-containing protein [Candidatus Hydrothermae bacterium]